MPRWTLACLVMAFLPPGAAGAQSGLDQALECEVNGYDLIIRNAGEETFPVGTPIEWTVRFSRSEGVHSLEKPFQPGDRVYLTGALEASYLEPGTPCTVAFARP